MNGNGSGNGTRSPDAIIADIEAIRSEMNSTLHAIEQRLTPGQMIDQGLDYLRNSGGREFLGNLGTSVKTHPLPATLVAVGLAWLMVTQQRDSRAGVAGQGEYDRDEPGLSAGDLAGRAADTAAAARGRVTETAQRARDVATDAAERTRAAYARTADAARMQMDRARSGYRQLVQEQPLALGALGLGVGAVLAAIAPRTRSEDEWMGSAAEAVRRNVVAAGREQLSRASEALAETKSDGAPAARRAQGGSGVPPLTGDNMARPTGSTRSTNPLDE